MSLLFYPNEILQNILSYSLLIIFTLVKYTSTFAKTTHNRPKFFVHFAIIYGENLLYAQHTISHDIFLFFGNYRKVVQICVVHTEHYMTMQKKILFCVRDLRSI